VAVIYCLVDAAWLHAQHFCFQKRLQALNKLVNQGCVLGSARPVSILQKSICKGLDRLT
jgi:hypothetical protein